jgi:hypothetical protein
MSGSAGGVICGCLIGERRSVVGNLVGACLQVVAGSGRCAHQRVSCGKRAVDVGCASG